MSPGEWLVVVPFLLAALAALALPISWGVSTALRIRRDYRAAADAFKARFTPITGARWGDSTPEMLAAMREVDALAPSVEPFLASPGTTRAHQHALCECGGAWYHAPSSRRSICATCGMVALWEVRKDVMEHAIDAFKAKFGIT